MTCNGRKHAFLAERSCKIRPVIMSSFLDKPVNITRRYISQSFAMIFAKVEHVGCSVVIEHGAIAFRDVIVGALSRDGDRKVGVIKIIGMTFSLWSRGWGEGVRGVLEVIPYSQGCFKGWFAVVDSVINEPLAVVPG